MAEDMSGHWSSTVAGIRKQVQQSNSSLVSEWLDQAQTLHDSVADQVGVKFASAGFPDAMLRSVGQAVTTRLLEAEQTSPDLHKIIGLVTGLVEDLTVAVQSASARGTDASSLVAEVTARLDEFRERLRGPTAAIAQPTPMVPTRR